MDHYIDPQKFKIGMHAMPCILWAYDVSNPVWGSLDTTQHFYFFGDQLALLL